MGYKKISKFNRLTGTISEAQFIVECLERKYKVSKPFDADCSYDFIVDSGNKLSKVQVKSCSVVTEYGYPVIELRKMRNGKRKTYSKEQIDIFAIHVKNEINHFWYILPVENAPKNGILKASIEGKYKIYKDNWELFGDSKWSR